MSPVARRVRRIFFAANQKIVDKNVESEYLTHVKTNISPLFIRVLEVVADLASFCAGSAKMARQPDAGLSLGRSYNHTE
jgi:hypothetical protein